MFKWFWNCTWDSGSGLDREACPGHSRQGCATQAGAIAGAKRHAGVCVYKGGGSGLMGWRYPEQFIYKVDGRKLRKK